jgi:hypothetical protein
MAPNRKPCFWCGSLTEMRKWGYLDISFRNKQQETVTCDYCGEMMMSFMQYMSADLPRFRAILHDTVQWQPKEKRKE